MKTSLVWVVLVILTGGCGHRALTLGGDGSPAPSADAGVPHQRGEPDGAAIRLRDSRTPNQVPGDQCMIAIRVDDCCTSPILALKSELSYDPCLLPYPAKNVPAECLARRPKICEVIDCAPGVPPSRVVGARPGGGCMWLDECQTGADCVMAIDYTVPGCCMCPKVYPKALLTNPCIIAGCTDDKLCPPPPCPQPPECLALCPCPPPPPGPLTCLKSPPADPGIKNRCQPWNPW